MVARVDSMKYKSALNILRSYLEKILSKFFLMKSPKNKVSPEFVRIAKDIGDRYAVVFKEPV